MPQKKSWTSRLHVPRVPAPVGSHVGGSCVPTLGWAPKGCFFTMILPYQRGTRIRRKNYRFSSHKHLVSTAVYQAPCWPQLCFVPFEWTSKGGRWHRLASWVGGHWALRPDSVP